MPRKPAAEPESPVQRSAPAGVGPRALAFWGRTVEDFELTDAELELLAEVVLTMTEIDALRALLDDGLKVAGSVGQVRIHPGVNEIRQHRALLARLLAALALPGEDVAPETQTTKDARSAANIRWEMTRRREAAHG